MGTGAFSACSISLVLLPYINLGKVYGAPTFPAACDLILWEKPGKQ